jgi:hypothetical protein
MEETLSEKVVRIFNDCLFTDEEVAAVKEEQLKELAVVVEGIKVRLGLNKERVEKNKSEIVAIINKMHPNFREGWSFLNLVLDKDMKQWASDHRTAEQLLILATAAGICRYTVPRQMWASMPGGLPYIQLDIEDRRCKTCRLFGTCPYMIVGRPDVKVFPSVGCDKWEKKVIIAG